MDITFRHIGWKSKVMQKRATFSISIKKSVVTGSCLEKGKELYCYLAEDESKRPIIVTYLDGEERNPLSTKNVRRFPVVSEKLLVYGV